MGPLRTLIVIGGVCGLTLAAVDDARAQLNNRPFAREPCGILHPCHPSFCGVFHRGSCTPYNEPPIGEDLRLTVVSTDDNEHGGLPDGDAAKAGVDQPGSNQTADGTPAKGDKGLDSIRAMFAALRACWVPPPKDESRHGMEYTVRLAFKRDGEMVAPPRVTYASHDAPAEVRDTYRDAVNAALARCTPLRFTDGMAGAVAGRPIAIRFVDNRTADSAKSQQ